MKQRRHFPKKQFAPSVPDGVIVQEDVVYSPKRQVLKSVVAVPEQRPKQPQVAVPPLDNFDYSSHREYWSQVNARKEEAGQIAKSPNFREKTRKNPNWCAPLEPEPISPEEEPEPVPTSSPDPEPVLTSEPVLASPQLVVRPETTTEELRRLRAELNAKTLKLQKEKEKRRQLMKLTSSSHSLEPVKKSSIPLRASSKTKSKTKLISEASEDSPHQNGKGKRDSIVNTSLFKHLYTVGSPTKVYTTQGRNLHSSHGSSAVTVPVPSAVPKTAAPGDTQTENKAEAAVQTIAKAKHPVPAKVKVYHVVGTGGNQFDVQEMASIRDNNLFFSSTAATRAPSSTGPSCTASNHS
mmetsp:Transcript_10929/g.20777  ORF Transcript_10929/g.20777 Transcript_10929/m.20777 type:complete len:351 (+) Transcript_10929:33-1085(+)